MPAWSPAPPSDEPALPLRAELFGAQRFMEHGRSLAQQAATVRAQPLAPDAFHPRLRDNLARLNAVAHQLEERAQQGRALAPAAEWLLDNQHLLEEQLATVQQQLPRGFFRRLPLLDEAPLTGVPRVMALAWAWVSHTDAGHDLGLLRALLEGHLSQTELSLAELWALPGSWRMLLLENLRRIADRVLAEQEAESLGRKLAAQAGSGSADAAVAEARQQLPRLQAQGQAEALLLTLREQLPTTPADSDAGPLAQWLAEQLPEAELDAAQQRWQAARAADVASVRNTIGSLREAARLDWAALIADISPVLRTLRRNPCFAAEHPSTQRQTVHAVERLARRSGRSEREVAEWLVACAAEAQPEPEAQSLHWWWCGGGEDRTRRHFGLAARPWPRRGSPAFAARGTPAYLLLLSGLTLAAVGLLLAAAHSDAPGLLLLLAGLLAAGPLSEAVVAVVNRLISESVPPAELPRLQLADGIPPEHATLVVIPALLSSSAGVDALLAQLEQHAIANHATNHAANQAEREPQLQFALLSDWADSPTEEAPDDDALLAHAQAGVAALNARHGAAARGPRFLLLHRPRRFSESEQKWIGWERKRGKLEQLIALLAQPGRVSPFMDLGALSQLPVGIRHLLTLDADTELPPGRLRALVGVAAHPMVWPVLGDQGQGLRVLRGHGVLQPRVEAPLPPAGRTTLFHALFHGQGGLDAYSAASSEVYQDLFGEGSFTGKGLLDVAAAHAVLGGRLPEGQVLSHDLLEGSLLRCAAVSDVAVMEDAPDHPDVQQSRLHRWTRGDWQLLPFLFPGGGLPLSAVQRWKMLDNLRRSLVAPLALALLLLVLASGVLPLGTALAAVLLAFGAGPLIGALAALAPSRDDISLPVFYRAAAADVLRAAGGALWQLALLLHHALSALDAVSRALWRHFVSRRGLLEWTTAAAAQAAAARDGAALWRQHRRTPLAAGGLLLLLMLAAAAGAAVQWPAALALLALWAAAPLWIQRALRPAPRWLMPHVTVREARAPLQPAEREPLQRLAADTWRWFEQHVGDADHHLPPDNVQRVPDTLVAHRTSPTNIGLYLLSALAAERLGLLTRDALQQRLQATLATVERLPSHRGHLYNWIATDTLRVLPPAYVSTVDSGNLCAMLLVLAQACREHGWAALAGRAEQLALRADFSVLYDPRSKLLHIGLNAETGQLDAGHYDLLASEARLASLFALAKGDVPAEHWGALARPAFSRGLHVGLRSWSGSMFEYLMPSLLLAEPDGSLLHQAARAAVQEQQRHGGPEGAGLPAVQGLWGVSESAVAAQDASYAYQYGPQGVPALALKRLDPDEVVLAPYAAVLGLSVDREAALASLRAFERLGARDEHGFFEAVDFTARRQAGGSGWTVVKTHMAHHQGMSLLAVVGLLEPGWLHALTLRQPHWRAVSLLLHERAPREVARLYAPVRRAARRARKPQPAAAGLPVHDSLPLHASQALQPATHWLGNGRQGLVIDNRGAGCSLHAGLALSRQRSLPLAAPDGCFAYLQRGDGPLHSLSALPAPDPLARYQTRLQPDRAIFDTQWPDLQAVSTLWCSPEDDAELRQLELHNRGPQPLQLTLWLAFEPTLTPPAADAAHPAFSNLFLRARWQGAQRALLLQRRPRLGDEPGLHAVLALVAAHTGPAASAPQAQALPGQTLLCTERARWWGRHGRAAQPLGAGQPADSSAELQDCETGGDPMAAVGLRITLAAGAQATLCWLLSAVQADAEAAEALLLARVDAHRRAAHRERSALIAHTAAAVRLHEQGLDAGNWQALLQLQSVLGATLPAALRLGRPETPERAARFDRQRLWPHGLGGERPLLLLDINSPQGVPLVRQLLRWLPSASQAGQGIDLVLLNSEPAGYLAPVQQALAALAPSGGPEAERAANGQPRARCLLLRRAELDADALHTLGRLARLRLQADGRSLAELMAALREAAAPPAASGASRVVPLPLPLPLPLPAPRASEPGREPAVAFDADSGAARFAVQAAQRSSRPWINVLANPRFGCQLSEMGGGHTWAGNSRQQALTAWVNDPVADTPSEWLLLQDESSGRCWPLGRWLTEDAPREIEYGPGWTQTRQVIDGIEITLRCCVDAEQALRQTRIRLREHSRQALPRRLRLVAFVPWQLGDGPAARVSVRTAALALPTAGTRWRSGVAVQAQQDDARHAVGSAWLALTSSSEGRSEWSLDERELVDAQGRLVLPDRLSGAPGLAHRPCGALGLRLLLPRSLDGEAPAELEAVLWLGQADHASALPQAVAQALAVEPAAREATQRKPWQDQTAALQVQSPDPLFNALFNHWLPYQTTACRLWARAGYYQAGGAFGFRDQLQDAMAMAWLQPALLAEQLQRSAARQFREGDVQHWWHEPGGAGVRTHFSDDRLWLPLALALYVQVSGDTALLDTPLPFLEGRAVPEGAEDVYEAPAATADTASLYEHAARAIDVSLSTGTHGLPLMGTGDWNDGMNRVGHEGRGESVWLAWFSIAVIDAMAPLARQRGAAERQRLARWQAMRQRWQQALDEAGWDGRWYRRAFFDDGSPLGSADNQEGRIDLIAQAWAVLAGSGDPERARIALHSAAEQLWQPEAGVLRLLDPPLGGQRPSAGYIQAYPPGVRENGGQYNHGAVWAVMAAAELHERCARAGRAAEAEAWRQRAWQWFCAISPAHRHQRGDYGGEPWAVAGDVQAAGRDAGRCGWSWYTGAAGWAWRAALQSLLGLQIDAQGLRLQPCLPPGWRDVTVRLQRPDGLRRLRLAADTATAQRLRADPLCGGELPLRQWQRWAQLPVLEGEGFLLVDASTSQAATEIGSQAVLTPA